MTKLMNLASKRDHHLGHLHASVILLEYGDFECPHCREVAPLMDELVNEFGSDLCFVYRHFPIASVHPYAFLAALASEAADQQDKFWSMHHLLFKNYNALDEEKILGLAKELRLNLGQFENDLKRADLIERVEEDYELGLKNKIDGTPTLFLNNELFDGDTSTLRRIIQEKIDLGRAEYSL